MEHFMEILGISWWGLGIVVTIIIGLTFLCNPSGTGPK
jgi:hypothetical protein